MTAQLAKDAMLQRAALTQVQSVLDRQTLVRPADLQHDLAVPLAHQESTAGFF